MVDDVSPDNPAFVRVIYDCLPVPIFCKDAQGIYIYCNRAFEEFIGIDNKNIIGKSIYAIQPHEYALIHDNVDKTVLNGSSREVYEGYIVDVKEVKQQVMIHKALVLGRDDLSNTIVGSFSSIKKSEDERYKTLFNCSKHAIFVLAQPDSQMIGKIIEVNNHAQEVLGYTKDELLKMTPYDFDERLQKGDTLPLEKLAEVGYTSFETVHITKAGKKIPVEVEAQMFNLEGQRACLSIVRDITERKVMAHEMARLERLHLVGEIAASIGHEVRNPMTTVRGFLQTLQNKKGCIDYKDYFDIMLEELDRANSIITEFISLAKNRTSDTRQVNLNEIINKLSPLLKANGIVNNKYIAIQLQDVPALYLDEKEIKQLIINLARNGIEAMSDGGYLTIKTYMDDNKVVLAVKDEGSGISEEIIDQLGKPFVSTKENGTGLGLAVCYSIASRNKAVITFETSSKGTTFYVKFEQ